MPATVRKNTLPPEKVAAIRAALAAGRSAAEIARTLGVDRATVRRYRDATPPPEQIVGTRLPTPTVPPRLPDPAPAAGGPRLPPSLALPRQHVHATEAGWWLVLGDTHFPMHDPGTIEAAFRDARERRAVGVLLNGDIVDMFSVSPFYREPTKEGLLDELDCTREALRWMRAQLPHARFIYREGNHDFRLRRYVVERGPALADLPELRLPHLLGLADLGIEWVQDKKKVYLGKLVTLHGHELRKGTGVNPARLAFLRATATVLVGHHHRTSEHHQGTLDDRHVAAWSVGCACYLHPDYDPYGQSNHGYAMVELSADGWYSVHNRRVMNGRVV